MHTIVITPEKPVSQEHKTCNQLLESQLYKLHVRKPSASEWETRAYLDQLDKRFLHKVFLHSHHHLVDELGLGGKHFKSDQRVKVSTSVSKSFHTMQELEGEQAALSYGFLSPIYDSISKPGYKSGFTRTVLQRWLTSFTRFPVFALGGIREDKVDELKRLNFEGVALMGCLWSKPDLSSRIKTAENFIHA